MIQEQTDLWTGDLILVGAHRTVRVKRYDIAMYGRDQAIQRAVLRAWRVDRMMHAVREQRIREQAGPYPV